MRTDKLDGTIRVAAGTALLGLALAGCDKADAGKRPSGAGRNSGPGSARDAGRPAAIGIAGSDVAPAPAR